jgi:hypothetical protein
MRSCHGSCPDLADIGDMSPTQALRIALCLMSHQFNDHLLKPRDRSLLDSEARKGRERGGEIRNETPVLARVRREQKAASKDARFGAHFTQMYTFSAAVQSTFASPWALRLLATPP